MQNVHFKVPIDPFGKARPRFSMASGRRVVHTATKTLRGEQLIRMYARRAMGNRYPFKKGTPLKVSIIAAFPIPKSYTQKRRSLCESGNEWPAKKPDIDNIVKAVLDAMNSSVFWDDYQVVELSVKKTYSSGEGYIEVDCDLLAEEQ